MHPVLRQLTIVLLPKRCAALAASAGLLQNSGTTLLNRPDGACCRDGLCMFNVPSVSLSTPTPADMECADHANDTHA